MKYSGRLLTPEEFGDIVIRSTEDGEVLKLKEIADIELGKESYAYIGQTNGKPGISCMVFQTAGSNATEVNNKIDAFLEEASKDFPKGIEVVKLMSTNDFLYASIHEVVKNLDRGHYPRYPCGICLLAGYPFYADSVGSDRSFLDRYVRLYDGRRI